MSDVLALIIARTAALAAVRHWLGVAWRQLDTTGNTLLLTIFVTGVMYLFDGYRTGELRRPEQELERTCKALSVAFAAVLSAEVLAVKGVPQSRYGTVVWYLLAVVLVLAGRFTVRALYAHLWKGGFARRRSVLIGSPEALVEFERHLAVQRYREYELLALISAAPGRENGATEAPLAGIGANIADWQQTVRRVQANVVIVNLAGWPATNSLLLDIAHGAQEMGIEVEICSPLLQTNRLNFEIDDCSGCLRLHPSRNGALRIQRAVKYWMDFLIGLIGSVVTLLIAPAIWLLVKIEDGGPLFHRREYVDCDGQVRYYLKFRTMVQNADRILEQNPEMFERFQANHKLRYDPRILRVGRIMRKLSIDEFPQFLSVLTGRLTFVGPRVISRAETARYGGYLAKRQSMKPGLTGYWQVMGRQNTTYDERIQMDMFYIDHWSIWLDIVIIGKTFRKFLAPEGAY